MFLIITGAMTSNFARKGSFLGTSTSVQVRMAHTYFPVPGPIYWLGIQRSGGMHSKNGRGGNHEIQNSIGHGHLQHTGAERELEWDDGKLLQLYLTSRDWSSGI